MKTINQMYTGCRVFLITDQEKMKSTGRDIIDQLSDQFILKAHVLNGSDEDLKIVNFLIKNKVQSNELIVNHSDQTIEQIQAIAASLDLNGIKTHDWRTI